MVLDELVLFACQSKMRGEEVLEVVLEVLGVVLEGVGLEILEVVLGVVLGAL